MSLFLTKFDPNLKIFDNKHSMLRSTIFIVSLLTAFICQNGRGDSFGSLNDQLEYLGKEISSMNSKKPEACKVTRAPAYETLNCPATVSDVCRLAKKRRAQADQPADDAQRIYKFLRDKIIGPACCASSGSETQCLEQFKKVELKVFKTAQEASTPSMKFIRTPDPRDPAEFLRVIHATQGQIQSKMQFIGDLEQNLGHELGHACADISMELASEVSAMDRVSEVFFNEKKPKDLILKETCTTEAGRSNSDTYLLNPKYWPKGMISETTKTCIEKALQKHAKTHQKGCYLHWLSEAFANAISIPNTLVNIAALDGICSEASDSMHATPNLYLGCILDDIRVQSKICGQ